MAEVVSTGVSHICDNSTVSVKKLFFILVSVYFLMILDHSVIFISF